MTATEPRTLQLCRRDLDLATYEGRPAQESDYHTLITAPTLVYDADAGGVTIVYLAPIAEDCRVLVDTLRHVDIGKGKRTSGMPTRSRIVGYRPRNALHDDFCSAADLATDDAEAHALVCSWASVVARYYQQYGPDVYAQHARLAQSVLPEWSLEGTAFTSGIINRDNPLPYHFDTGNFRGVWSNMLGFKGGVRGGYLAVPEYDLGFEIADKSLLMFDGQRLLHGVTPFSLSPGGYRFTIVYYSLEQMWRCLPPDKELVRIRQQHAARDH